MDSRYAYVLHIARREIKGPSIELNGPPHAHVDGPHRNAVAYRLPWSFDELSDSWLDFIS